MKFETIRNFQQWALPYFINADDSGLDADDISTIEKWEKANPEIRVVSPVDGTENEFCPFPEFGLACETVNVVVEIVA